MIDIPMEMKTIMGLWNRIFQKRNLERQEGTSGKDSQDEQKRQNEDSQIGSTIAGVETARQVQATVAQKFAVPDTYTGNRYLYDDPNAKIAAKKALFKEGTVVKDPYTGERLVLTKKEAKLLYGKDWTKHLAESDHIKALEEIYRETKDNPWLTNEDRRNIANSENNIRVTSRQYNNAKRSRTNKEFVDDKAYRKKTGVKLTRGGGQRAIRDEENAAAIINSQLRQKSMENIISTGHQAGTQTGTSAGVTAVSVATIQNIVQVIKGEKKPGDAIKDIAVTGGQAAVTGYVTGGGLTILSHTLSRSSSGFIQGLMKSNVPGLVINSCMAFGNTLDRYADGKISTQVCLTELGADGLRMGSVGYSMGVGQALIPVPIVGAAIGAAVGAVMTGSLYNMLLGSLGDTEDIRYREKLICQCQEAAEQARQYRRELQAHMDAYFADYGQCFDEALAGIRFSFAVGDADGVIRGANQITRKVGGTVKYESVEEFKTFIDDEEEDLF